MRLLLDTHTLIWWLNGAGKKLSIRATKAIADRNNQVFVSAVSAWEIGTKVVLQKLPEAAGVPANFDALINEHSFAHLALAYNHALRSADYGASNRDPFDRMLAAQAELEDLTLVSVDEKLAAFPCRVLW
ncbi:MAG: type II toxin-antitoxin system VapC family toxin [Pacificimonas sp.]